MEKQIIEELQKIRQLTLLQSKNVLTIGEVSMLTNLSVSHLYKLVHYKRIPHFKPNGKMLYFNKSEVEAWLLKNRISTTDEIEEQATNYLLRKKGVGYGK